MQGPTGKSPSYAQPLISACILIGRVAICITVLLVRILIDMLLMLLHTNTREGKRKDRSRADKQLKGQRRWNKQQERERERERRGTELRVEEGSLLVSHTKSCMTENPQNLQVTDTPYNTERQYTDTIIIYKHTKQIHCIQSTKKDK